MSVMNKPQKTMTLTLRVFAHLLSYPDATLREHLPELRAALHKEGAIGNARLREIDQFINRLHSGRAMDTEAAYVELFDRGRGTALHLFEHVHGDSRDRGPAMIDLIKTYEEAGLHLNSGELPDHLPVVLQYASTQPWAEARLFLNEIAHILQAIFSALNRRESAYACVLAGLLELAGKKAQAVELPLDPDNDLDATWQEPPVFDGCSIAGQTSPMPLSPGTPGQPQAVTIGDWRSHTERTKRGDLS